VHVQLLRMIECGHMWQRQQVCLVTIFRFWLASNPLDLHSFHVHMNKGQSAPNV
jgi:hypothetical protein